MAESSETGTGVRRKRRLKNVCANPLFVKWVEEWRDEARERGVKTQYTYNKALSSLKKYPLPLRSGQEAKILDYVGEKLAKMLDRRLAEHQADEGLEDPPNTSSSYSTTRLTSVRAARSGGKGQQKKRKKSKTDVGNDPCPPVHPSQLNPSPPPSSSSSSSPSSSSTMVSDTTPSSWKASLKRKAPREYVPAYRSGPYAVLVALYDAQKNQLNYRGYMRKSSLIDAAQPYCDTSFTIPDAGSYYTAWSSTSALIRRGLVNKYSNPPRYALMAAGAELAERLIQGTVDAVSDAKRAKPSPTTLRASSSSSSSPSSSPPPRHSGGLDSSPYSPVVLRSSPAVLVNSPPSSPLSGDLTAPYDLMEVDTDIDSTEPKGDAVSHDNKRTFHSHPPSSLLVPTSEVLQFWYVDPGGRCVQSKDRAAVTFNEEISVGFLIKCRGDQLETCNLKYSKDHCSKPQGPYIYVYLSNDNAPESCCPPPTGPATTSVADHKHPSPSLPPPASLSLKSSRVSLSHQDSIVLSDSDSDVEVVPLAERLGVLGEKLKGKWKTKASDLGKRTGILQSGKVQTPPSRELPSFCGERKEISGSRGGEVTEAQGTSLGNEALKTKELTPAQKAGFAALRRLKASSGAGQSKEARIPVLDLTDEEIDSVPPPARGSASTSHRQHVLAKQSLPSLNAIAPSSPVLDLTMDDSPPMPAEEDTYSCKVAPVRSESTGRESGWSSRPVGGTSSYHHDLTPSPPLASRQAPTTSLGVSATGKEGNRPGPSSVDSVDLSKPEFVLKPGQFELVLCIDNAESTASRKSSSQFRGLLLQELGKNGVRFDVRKLNVGDFLWIAKEKTAPLQGRLMLPRSREAVLEYVVERKRMDDLAGSIIDGRFHDQKFRLGNCGVRNSIYLVEEHGDVAHLKLTQRTLEQAITNTQVISGFFVKKTKDIRESVAYLTVMTRFLQQHYSRKTVKVYPWETIVHLNQSSIHDKDASIVYSMPLDNFNEVSVKSKVLTVYEMFGRQLVHLPKFSIDRAFAVLEKYPTVSHLRQAYQQCASEKERENLLSDIRAGSSKRKLGSILSSMVYSLYWKGD